jgi:TRAP-type C4-dicarboxylate transport system permease small subunit
MDIIAQIPNYSDPTGQTPTRISDLEAVFARVVSVAIGFAGLALFIMLLVGGFKYLTSGGNPKSAEAASKIITYAIGGLVLVALAYLILLFIETFTGANVTQFRVEYP